MKVFKMNDYDWVAAKSMTEAVEWYAIEHGLDWVEDACDLNPIECDIDAPLWYNPDIYNEPDKRIVSTFRKLMESFCHYGVPYIILSTEY